MIKRDGEQYLRAAQMIAEAEDPREEILRVARIASQAARTKRRVFVGSSVLGVLLAGVITWALVNPPAREGEPAPRPGVDRAQEAAWVTERFTTAVDTPLTPQDEQRLRRYMQAPDPAVEDTIVKWQRALRARVRSAQLSTTETGRLVSLLHSRSNAVLTWSLNVLTLAGAEIPEERLVWFLSNPEPRLIAMALRATWVHCARNGTFSDPTAIETFVYGEDRELQKTAILSLSSLKKYVPSDRLMDFLESGDREIRQIAGELLRRKGQ